MVLLALLLPTVFRWGIAIYDSVASGSSASALQSEGRHGVTALSNDLNQATTCDGSGGMLVSISPSSISFYTTPTSGTSPNLVTWTFTSSHQLTREQEATSGPNCTAVTGSSTSTQIIFSQLSTTTPSFTAYYNNTPLANGSVCSLVNTSCNPQTISIYAVLESTGPGSPTYVINSSIAVNTGI